MGSVIGFFYAVVCTVLIFVFIAMAVAVGVYFGNKWSKNGLPPIFRLLETKDITKKRKN